MKKIVVGSCLAFLLVFVLLFSTGCEDSLDFPTTTTTLPSSQVTMSGTLYSGTTASSAQGVKSLAAATGYLVVAQNADSGALEYASADSSGRFEFTLPSNQTYTINVIDADAQYTGPMVVSDMGGSQAAMGLSLSSTLELGDVLVNTTTGKIAPTSAVGTGHVAAGQVARTDANGAPLGVGNAGKGSAANYSGTLQAGFDSDKDGLPNFVDADNNGNGVIDELDPGSGVTTESVTDNARIDSVDVYTSLNLSYDNVQNFSPAQHSGLEFLVTPDPSVVSLIDSVAVTSIPAQYANAEFIEAQTVNGVTYPDHAKWRTASYGLGYIAAAQALSGKDQWSAYIRPLVLPQPGDMFVFRVNYSDGTYDEFSRMVNYRFSTIPSLESYQLAGDVVRAAPAVNSPPSPFTLVGTTEITLNYGRPTDEDGNVLTGFAYEYYIELYKTYQASWPDSEFVDTISGTITSADDGSGNNVVLHYVLPTSYGGENIRAYRVSLRCATPPGAGNASSSLLMYFER